MAELLSTRGPFQITRGPFLPVSGASYSSMTGVVTGAAFNLLFTRGAMHGSTRATSASRCSASSASGSRPPGRHV